MESMHAGEERESGWASSRLSLFICIMFLFKSRGEQMPNKKPDSKKPSSCIIMRISVYQRLTRLYSYSQTEDLLETLPGFRFLQCVRFQITQNKSDLTGAPVAN